MVTPRDATYGSPKKTPEKGWQIRLNSWPFGVPTRARPRPHTIWEGVATQAKGAYQPLSRLEWGIGRRLPPPKRDWTQALAAQTRELDKGSQDPNEEVGHRPPSARTWGFEHGFPKPEYMGIWFKTGFPRPGHENFWTWAPETRIMGILTGAPRTRIYGRYWTRNT
jgi:hypothetical protein